MLIKLYFQKYFPHFIEENEPYCSVFGLKIQNLQNDPPLQLSPKEYYNYYVDGLWEYK